MKSLGEKMYGTKNVAAAGVLLLAAIAGTVAISWKNGTLPAAKESIVAAARSVFSLEEKVPHAVPLSESEPVRLRIPDIFIDTNFVPLGLQDNGEIEIPEGYTEVGWYTYGPTPGEIGPSVVLGHVDSYQGPGVFLFLGQLKEGNLVYVDRKDGTTATFRVTGLERYNRDEFPTQKVYGNLDYAGIRLITCSGTYNHETLEYDRVLVVYGELVDETMAQ